MKIEIFDGNWTIDDVKSQPNKIFVFGDNNVRVGKGGQAIIRDLPNTAGIRTKKGPSNKPAAFYNDSEYLHNVKNIREDILNIKKQILSGKSVVFSNGGYGTGLAQLEKIAPKTFSELCNLLLGHFGFDNRLGKIQKRIPGYDEITSGKYVSIDNKEFESNVLTPVNNSFFKKEYLSQNINSLYDLILKGKKIAFTYPIKHNYGDVVILTFASSTKYLVCRVVDSYDYKSVDNDTWSLFEGYENNFIENLELSDNNQSLYQNHIEFICSLDESGKMEFKDDIFNPKPINNSKEPIIAGQTTVSTEKDEKLLKVEKLLESKGMIGELRRINDTEQFSSKEMYQLKSDGFYYAVEYKKLFIWESVNILLKSRNPFI